MFKTTQDLYVSQHDELSFQIARYGFRKQAQEIEYSGSKSSCWLIPFSINYPALSAPTSAITVT